MMGKLLQSALVALYAYPAYQLSLDIAPALMPYTRFMVTTGFGLMCMVWTVQLYLWMRYDYWTAMDFKFTWEK